MNNTATALPLEVKLALGRIFAMGARPTQPGDIEMYEKCRAIIVGAAGGEPQADWAPNRVRDRNKGAAGD